VDPAGVPLVSVTLRGSQNDSPVYLPLWRPMAEIIGRPDSLLVGDCKLSSRGNRMPLHLAQGRYLSPLAMTGQWPRLLRDWVCAPPVAVEDVRLVDQEPGEEPAYRGFAMCLGTLGKDPTTHARVGWLEQVFGVGNVPTAPREVQDLHRRLERAEAGLAEIGRRPGADLAALPHKVAALLAQAKVADYREATVRDTVVREERLVGRGRRGANRPTRIVETHHLELTVLRRTGAIAEAEKLAGWRLYVTNAAPQRMSLAQSIDYSRDEGQPERGFPRWKRGALPALSIYLKHEERIYGLMVLLSRGLRVLTLSESVVRRALSRCGETLPGLSEGNRKRATDRPTTERLLRAFEGIVLYRSQIGGETSHKLTPLTDLQIRILNLMSLPPDLYAVLVPRPEFADTS
jgi:transposase